MVAPYKPPQRQRPFYKHRVFSRTPKVPVGFREVPTPQPLTDQYGLSITVFGHYPAASRRAIAIGLKHFGLPLDRNPSPFATAAEMVMMGLFLDAGLTHYVGNDPAEGTFVFQSYELGGRQPGGAVVDFVVFRGGTIGVRVQSIFHAANSPFANGAGGFRERFQEIRLLGSGFRAVIDVNEPGRGYPLEQGPDSEVRYELVRVLNALN